MPPNSSTLLKIYDQITMEKCSYCFLCFRTESESKLKVPRPNLKSITSLSIINDINNKSPRICYMCETLVMAAAKLRKAAFFATSIGIIFKQMMQSGKYHAEVRRLLETSSPVDQAEYDRHRTLLLDERELTTYRRSMQLQQTDVVVIDTNTAYTTDPNTTIKTTLQNTLDPLEETIDISEDTGGCQMDEQQDTPDDTQSDDIMILDDAPTTTQGPMTRSKTKATHTPTLYKHLALRKNMNKEKVAKTPSNLVQQVDKPTEKNPTLVPIKKLLQNQTVQTPVASVGYLHPIYKTADGSRTVPTLSAQLLNGQLFLTQNTATPSAIENSAINVPEASESEPILESEQNSDIQETVDKILYDKLDGIKRNKKLVKVVVDGENKVVREPVMRTDRIDWEDKIPMDVISFVDATDPNPPSYIQPLMPAGTITNVRTLNDIYANTESKPDVIDLC